MAPFMNRLDQDVYQVVRKFETAQLEARPDSEPKLTVDGVYDSIKKSNSSLARGRKRQLEDSIERVLRQRKEERMADGRDKDDEDEAMMDAPVDIVRKVTTAQERDHLPKNKQPTVGMQDRPGDGGEPAAKRRRGEVKDRSPRIDASYESLGGMGAAITQLLVSVGRPLIRPQDYTESGVDWTRGVLLHGPPGCGKTKLANAFAADMGVSFIPVSAPSLVAGMSGESEKQIRKLYSEAASLAPCLVFIDEIDAIMGKRDNAQREMEKRMVAQMLTCMDDLTPDKTGGKPVITIAATNRPDSIDPALRRAGRFNTEISLGVPDERSRVWILEALLRKHAVSDHLDLPALAKMTPGFVGADLEDVLSIALADMMERSRDKITRQAVSSIESLGQGLDRGTDTSLREAIMLSRAMKATKDQDTPRGETVLTQQDLILAVSKVQPSAKREGFTTIPDTTWAQVGAMQGVREQLRLAITRPIDAPERFAKVGWSSPSGVLLWGPPGCGKTLVAKAVANESQANFISVKGPELLNKYVGESERSVRQVFARARSSAPCILFFDEMDALVPRRGDSISEASARVVNTLLTELDGINSRTGVYVIAATNRPDVIDPAILRPGRLGTTIFVGLPDEDSRVDILQTRMKTVLPHMTATDLDALAPIARRCEGFSGADLENLHIEACKASIKREDVDGVSGLMAADWQAALGSSTTSVGKKEAKKYQELRDKGWR